MVDGVSRGVGHVASMPVHTWFLVLFVQDTKFEFSQIENKISWVFAETINRWLLIERGSIDQDSEGLTTLTRKNAYSGVPTASQFCDDSLRNPNDCISSPPPVTSE